MANRDKDKALVGTLSLVLVMLVTLGSVSLALFVGIMFGAQWGWLTVTVLMVAYCVVVGSTIRKMAREGRDDG